MARRPDAGRSAPEPDAEARADRIGAVLAVGSRPSGSGEVVVHDRPEPGEPTLRWRSRARSIEQIEQELGRIWADSNRTALLEGESERRVAARTSVLNLVVVARRPELGERSAAVISKLAGRHPSRTLILSSADPDGPSWLDAQIQAHCVLAHADAAETCAEMIYLTAGGEAGRHLQSIVAPLLIHDLPVMLWWPGEPPIGSKATEDAFGMADRVIVDGSSWSGDGLELLARMSRLVGDGATHITDFALLRQSRWREAIASTFDDPELVPYLPFLRRISITYATHDETGAAGSTNVVKPVYHVGWLASRLGLSVVRPLHPVDSRPARPTRQSRVSGKAAPLWHGMAATLAGGRGEVAVVVRPLLSTQPAGNTLRVELLCQRRGSELRVDVTAEAQSVNVHAWQDGVAILERSFLAPRRTEVDLVAETIEATGHEQVATGAIRAAAALAAGYARSSRSGGSADAVPSSAAGLA
jgi:glucose-6-phosphate dehydrogenase assembly protein OpcA